MAQALPAFDRALLGVLMRGAEKALENAESLCREAEILASTGATARALFLHQISLEECSKIDSIGEWATCLLAGHKVNQKRMLAALSRHSYKNYTNAYMLEGSQAEKEAKERGDWKAAWEAFNKLKVEFHERSNDAKNAALYVDWNEREFVAPRERINTKMLAEIIARNKTFLSYAHNNLRTLKRLERAPDETQGRVVELVEMTEKMRGEAPDEVTAAIYGLIRKFLDIERNNNKN